MTDRSDAGLDILTVHTDIRTGSHIGDLEPPAVDPLLTVLGDMQRKLARIETLMETVNMRLAGFVLRPGGGKPDERT